MSICWFRCEMIWEIAVSENFMTESFLTKISKCSSEWCFVAIEAMNIGLKYEMGRNYFLKQVRQRVMKQTLGVYPAPLRIIDVCIALTWFQSFLPNFGILHNIGCDVAQCIQMFNLFSSLFTGDIFVLWRLKTFHSFVKLYSPTLTVNTVTTHKHARGWFNVCETVQSWDSDEEEFI